MLPIGRAARRFNGLLVVDTRPSRIYATLFSTLGDNAGIFRDLLIAIAVVFGVIELIALFIGVRLTRSMTKSVSRAVHRDRAHQSRRTSASHQAAHQRSDGGAGAVVQLHDQSLANLIAEQKEKQRMEGELAIAHEVQDAALP